jgi:hypothetical protein
MARADTITRYKDAGVEIEPLSPKQIFSPNY